VAVKIESRDLLPMLERGELSAAQIRAAYNALDSGVTLHVHDSLSQVIASQNSPHAATSYRFVRAMQAPALDMMNRGVAINAKVRQDETERYANIRDKAQALLDRLADAVWGPEKVILKDRTKELYTPLGVSGKLLKPRYRTVVTIREESRPRGLSATSTKQCLAFFNIALGCEPAFALRKTPTGTERTPSADEKALRKWAERRSKGPGVDPRDRTVPPVRFAAPFVALILTIREADKMLAVLRTPLDPDGRMRCSYNIAGTENGRWSSSKNVHGRGTNLQNITPSMRRMFCADADHRFVSTDLEQAESRVVAGLVWQATGDDTYLRACESGDLHTTVARMTWPELGWTDDAKANRKIADQPSRELPKFSYRDVSKRLGHGSNYRGSPFGIAQAVGIPSHIVEDFQRRYFHAFPALSTWHDWCKHQLLDHQYLDTPLGRRRWFFGRVAEDATLREAIAYAPQSTVGELLNYIMYRVWFRSTLPKSHTDFLPIQLLLQNHDAFAFQTHTREYLPTIIQRVNTEFTSAAIPLHRNGETRQLIIPGEFVTGFNWGYADDPSKPREEWTYSDGNPDGLRKWRGEDNRTRTQGARATAADWIGRPIQPAYRAR